MIRTSTTLAVLGAAMLAPGVAAADVPARLPVQGFLTDAGDAPIDDTVQIEFRLYDVSTGGTAWHVESQVVPVERGELTAYLGTNNPLDLTGFAGGSSYLGITIAGEAEMTPRLAIGSVPYAAYSQETASVPPGAVMMFDLDACPAGWSPLDAARGRELVGAPDGGTVAGSVGAPLGDLENRSHTHGIPALDGTAASAGAHTHGVNVSVAIANTTVSWAHTHSVDPPPHQHRWASYYLDATDDFSKFGTWTSGDTSIIGQTKLQGWGDGMDNAGTGYFPLAVGYEATGSPIYHYTSSYDQGSFGTGAASSSSGAHTHTASATANSTSSGSHTHPVATTAATSGGAAAGMPYLQLLVCRKD